MIDKRLRLVSIWLSLICALNLFAQTVHPSLTLENGEIEDQDDMCIWIHPDDPAQSTIIAADKSANMLFVYDLAGNTIQSIADGFRPGNIDIRYHFPFAGQEAPIVAFNDRLKSIIIVYKIDPASRMLERIDDGKIETVNNYGFCLYRSPKTGKQHGFATTKNGNIQHFTLFDRKAPHPPVGNFDISGVSNTDGIDVANVPLNGNFSQGIFTYHNGKNSPYPVGIAKWEEIAGTIGSGLIVDTEYWNPSTTQSTAVATVADLLPEDFSLQQNYPNPFNPETTIEFKLNKPAQVKLMITDILGGAVRTLVDERLNAGHYKTVWDGRDAHGRQVAAGTYLYRIENENLIVTKKLALVK